MSGNAGVLRILVLGGFRLGDTGVVEVLCGGRGCSWLFQGCGVAYGLCPKSRARRSVQRFILLGNFSDTLLVVSILDICRRFWSPPEGVKSLAKLTGKRLW